MCKKIGASAAEERPDGSPLYTLPVIYDPNTKSVVSDSAAITRYLDKTYPHTPQLIPEDADVLITAFENAVFGAFQRSTIAPIILPAAFNILRPASQPYFRETREKRLGGKLEELAPVGSEKRATAWQGVQNGAHKIADWFEADGKKKVFVMGDKKGITYADLILASFFMWFKKCCGEESPEWKDMTSWDGGRWATLLSALENYETVDEGEDVNL